MKELAPKAGPLEFSVPLEVLIYPDPKLRAPNLPIENFDDDLATLASEMFKTMYRTVGVGLAAPQVGVNVQLMVYNPEGDPNKGKEYVLVNPRIVKKSKDTDFEAEGCLSFPEIEGDVERSLTCKVEYRDLSGKRNTFILRGWQARIFQHEYDHLEKILFHDRMSPEVLETVQPQLTALEEAYNKNNS
ncbi:Peptide deformylase 1B, chloroplastic [Cymbomonas tetramitiformis]|uniref:Peptide deformylase n=1 Tax=Cymbomonas tetramitiformis TaxID=36881 RepID=A0AAE0FRQ5_9CHLO|nr:Peptide deformylase 1B, chloroplastic [Cymbomonas tetramitiformis]